MLQENVESRAVQVGSGPPILLLHSGFGTWLEWRSLIGLLSPHREVLAATMPGSAGGGQLDLSRRTMLDAHADRVEELLDAAGWSEPVEMVGSSFGGVTAMELAVRGRASKVIALAPPWVQGRGAVFYGALFGSSLPLIRLTEPLPFKRQAFGLVMHGSTAPPGMSSEDAKAIWRSWGRFPFFRAGAELARSGARGPGIPDLERVRVPVDLVWGGADRLVPGWMRERWHRALPDARVRTLPDLPHCPQLRDPDAVAELILDAG